MITRTAKFADQALRHSQIRALVFGGLLGWLTWALSTSPERTAGTLAAAIVMVGCGAAAFVLHALHVQGLDRRPNRAQRGAETRRCLAWLGCGLALSVQASHLLLS